MPAASTVTSGNSPVSAACPAHLAPRARLMTGMETSLPHRMTAEMCGEEKSRKMAGSDDARPVSPHPGHRNFQGINDRPIGRI